MNSPTVVPSLMGWVIWAAVAATACASSSGEPNRPPTLDYDLLVPSASDPVECPADGVLELNATDAVGDPDGDPLFTLWYVDYSETVPIPPAAAQTLTFQLTCGNAARPQVVELIVMDRESSGTSAAEIRSVVPGGFKVQARWEVRAGQ